MLTEITTLRQRQSELRKRWFNDADFDLYVWHRADGSVCRFELCYDKQLCERAIRWDAREGVRMFSVDDGEPRAHYKMAPIMWSQATRKDATNAQVADRFRVAARDLDPGIVALVCARLGAPPVRLA